MKGKLSRGQLIASGVIVLLVLGAGVLGWLGLGGLTEELGRAQELSERKGNGDLSAILSRSGGIAAAKKDAEEIGKLGQDLGKLDETLIGPWRKGLEEASGQGQDWSKDPGKWKDKLVSDNDDILKKCGRSGDLNTVTLGANFYLGLEEFKQKSPSAEQVPALARQLSVAKKLVDLLISAKKTREGYVTPCVLHGLEVPGSSESDNPDAKRVSKGTEDKNGEVLRERYRLTMACSPEVLYEYVNLLQQDPWLFIVTNLSLANERESFPKRGEIAKLFEAESSANVATQNQDGARGGEKGSGKPKLLLVLSGKERVEVSLDIDYIGWKNIGPVGKSQESKK